MNVIKITENEIKTLIKECVQRIIKEDNEDDFDFDMSDTDTNESDPEMFFKVANKVKKRTDKLIRELIGEDGNYIINWVTKPTSGVDGFRKISDTRYAYQLVFKKKNPTKDRKIIDNFKTRFNALILEPTLSRLKSRKNGELMSDFLTNKLTGEKLFISSTSPLDNSGKNNYIKFILVDTLAENN